MLLLLTMLPLLALPVLALVGPLLVLLGPVLVLVVLALHLAWLLLQYPWGVVEGVLVDWKGLEWIRSRPACGCLMIFGLVKRPIDQLRPSVVRATLRGATQHVMGGHR